MLAKIIEFFSADAEAYKPVQIEKHDEVIETDEDVDHGVTWTEVDQLFTGLLLGVNSLLDDPMCKIEKSSLDSIYEQYLQRATPEYMVPRLPAVIPKVMMALREKETDVASLANILSGDMALVGEVIRLANSPYYRRVQVYESLEQAIVNIGFNGIRQMVISAAMKPIFNSHSGHFVNNSNRYLWDKSMNAGQLSDCAAKIVCEDSFHAYLASLTVQSGMTVLIKELDKCFDGMEAPRNRLFIDDFNRYAYEVSVRISEQWQFPEAVTNALQEQTSCDDPQEMSNLGQITYLSDKLAKVNLLMANGYMRTFDGDVSKLIKGDMHDVYIHCLKKMDNNG